MTQEQKNLLLKDLCSRLPYEVKVEYNGEKYKIANVSICNETITIYGERGYPMEVEIKKVKPYLFPMSSMTEEQYNEMQTISGKDCMEHMEIEKEWRNNSPFTHLPLYQHRVIEFFHKYHFDYRGLIPMGLAIDATGLNIY